MIYCIERTVDSYWHWFTRKSEIKKLFLSIWENSLIYYNLFNGCGMATYYQGHNIFLIISFIQPV